MLPRSCEPRPCRGRRRCPPAVGSINVRRCEGPKSSTGGGKPLKRSPSGASQSPMGASALKNDAISPCNSLRYTCRCRHPDPIAVLHDSLGSEDTLKQWAERTGVPRSLNSRPIAAAACPHAPPVAMVRTQSLKPPQPRSRRWPLACGIPSARLGLALLYSFSKLPVEPRRCGYAEAAN